MPSLMDVLKTIAFPQENTCHLCDRWVDGALVCPQCQKELNLLRCPRQARAPYFPLTDCASVWHYEEPARQLVHLLKYQGDATIAQYLGAQLSLTLLHNRPMYERAQLIVPVPLHAQRLRERGYNQALLLARELSSHTGIPMAADALIRTKATPTLVRSSRLKRMQTVRHAFAAQRALVEDKRILLVDDVFTTGATAVCCAIALLEAGASEASVITVCRTPLDHTGGESI